jgi:uncharacterized protein YkvS
MKNILLIIGTFCILASCKNGDDGKSFITVKGDDANFALLYYSDNNSSHPNPYYIGVEYPTNAGTFNFYYELNNGFSYSGTYTIDVEKGETWNAISNGYLLPANNGKERHYIFHCVSYQNGLLNYTLKQSLVNHNTINVDTTLYENNTKINIKVKGVYNPTQRKVIPENFKSASIKQ